MEKILIFGGSFNPIHFGHIEMAKRVGEQIGADRTVFIPTGKSGYKQTEDFASREDRFNMCALALKNTQIEISTIELDREEQSYTYQTVRELKAQNPQSKLYFLCGSDMFLTLHSWRKPKEILKYSAIVAIPRGSDELAAMQEYKERYFKEDEIIFADVGKIDISSSQIRSAVREGKTPEGLDDAVYGYIMQKGLYR